MVSNCTIFQNFSKVSIILSSQKYNTLTPHNYLVKLCQDILYSVVFLKKNLAEHIPYFGIQSANVIIILSPKVLFSSQDVNNMYSNEPNCTVSKIFLNEHILLVCQQQK